MLIRLGPVGLSPSAPVLPAHFSVCALTTLSTPAERTTSSVQRWASAETALVDQAVMHLRFRFIHATYHPSDLPNHLPGKPEPRQPSCLHWLPSCHRTQQQLRAPERLMQLLCEVFQRVLGFSAAVQRAGRGAAGTWRAPGVIEPVCQIRLLAMLSAMLCVCVCGEEKGCMAPVCSSQLAGLPDHAGGSQGCATLT